MRLIAGLCSATLVIIAAFTFKDDPGGAWFMLAVAGVWALHAIAWSRP